MKLRVNRSLPLAALIVLGAGTVAAKDRPAALPPTGPAADYPVVVGEPFTIGRTVWTPIDQLNYDAVGFASVGEETNSSVIGAHKTLPLPSYVEVTSLASGKTILVRLERRGPMSNEVLIELSARAAGQLGLAAGERSAVRVRRVNPPESERALLRGGDHPPQRMETPEGLLKVLRRKLAEQSPLVPPPSSPPAMPSTPPPVAASKPATKPATTKKAPTAPAQRPVVAAPTIAASTPLPTTPKPPRTAEPAAKGSLVVQVGAFSVEANARKVASQLGGTVSRSGKFWRVRMGPFANRGQASPALEKAHRAGYSGARIQPAG